MSWEDTMVKIERTQCEHNTLCSILMEKVKAQAKITWDIAYKAGYEQRKDEELPYYNEERKVGIREVVEWGLEACPHWSGEWTRKVGVSKRDCSLCWLDQLKDWELTSI